MHALRCCTSQKFGARSSVGVRRFATSAHLATPSLLKDVQGKVAAALEDCRCTSMTLSDVTARPLCAMGSPEPASMVRSVLSRYICEHIPSLYTSRAAAAREPFRT
eukprot:SAG25_NODE_149_length_13742_cov_17.202155_17_plen_106_part_00